MSPLVNTTEKSNNNTANSVMLKMHFSFQIEMQIIDSDGMGEIQSSVLIWWFYGQIGKNLLWWYIWLSEIEIHEHVSWWMFLCDENFPFMRMEITLNDFISFHFLVLDFRIERTSSIWKKEEPTSEYIFLIYVCVLSQHNDGNNNNIANAE